MKERVVFSTVVEEVFSFFTQVKAAVPHCENTPLQVKVLQVCKYYQQNVLKVSKIKVLILQKDGPCQCFSITYDLL